MVPVCRGAKAGKALRAKAAACRIHVATHSDGAIVPDFTHFVVAGELVLSLHALLAMADGRPIVTPAWLEQSASAGCVLEPRAFLVHDARAEKLHRFCYSSAWAGARKERLLEGRRCLILESLTAAEADGGRGLRLVVTAALGETGELVVDAAAGEGAVVLCADKADKRAVRRSAPAGATVWTRSQFVKAIVQQSFAQQKAYMQT